jgi:uncharacterized membrane protein
MNGMSVFLLARLIHVVAGVTWAGALIFIPWFLLPAVRATGPAGGTFIQQIVRIQKLPVYLITLMALTVLSGLSLYWLDIVAFGRAWMHTGPGRTFSLGAALAILAALLGMVVNAPTAGKMAALSASIQASGAPPSTAQGTELARLQNRLNRAGRGAAALILLAVACMGVARYVP